MTPPELAVQILTLVGGAGNVQSLTHCISRLRFVLAEPGRAQDAAIESLDGVVMVLRQSGQVQVAVRSGVLELHEEVAALLA